MTSIEMYRRPRKVNFVNSKLIPMYELASVTVCIHYLMHYNLDIVGISQDNVLASSYNTLPPASNLYSC